MTTRISDEWIEESIKHGVILEIDNKAILSALRELQQSRALVTEQKAEIERLQNSVSHLLESLKEIVSQTQIPTKAPPGKEAQLGKLVLMFGRAKYAIAMAEAL